MKKSKAQIKIKKENSADKHMDVEEMSSQYGNWPLTCFSMTIHKMHNKKFKHFISLLFNRQAVHTRTHQHACNIGKFLNKYFF